MLTSFSSSSGTLEWNPIPPLACSPSPWAPLSPSSQFMSLRTGVRVLPDCTLTHGLCSPCAFPCNTQPCGHLTASPAIQVSAWMPPSQTALLSPPSTAPPPLTSYSSNSLHITHRYCWHWFTISPTALWAHPESELSFVSLTAVPPEIRVCSIKEWMNENPHPPPHTNTQALGTKMSWQAVLPCNYLQKEAGTLDDSVSLQRHRIKTEWNWEMKPRI